MRTTLGNGNKKDTKLSLRVYVNVRLNSNSMYYVISGFYPKNIYSVYVHNNILKLIRIFDLILSKVHKTHTNNWDVVVEKFHIEKIEKKEILDLSSSIQQGEDTMNICSVKRNLYIILNILES